ncbi:MAG: hypothetical protein HQ551_13485 [Desulfobacteraceae bacterium]|nr:hypothetical protein [Desulfobacteraceae bacterium]
MSDSVNMIQFVTELARRPKGRAAVVLTYEYEGQKEWAAQLARQTNSEHINLLELFSKDLALSNGIEQFLVRNVFDFLKDRSQAPVLIISGMEFLKATWTGQSNSVEEFASQVQTWNKSPCLLFVLQYDKLLARYDFGQRFRQYTFVVDQKETLAL